MTDRHDPLDDLASAHLDGETTPQDAARIAADPALLARVERMSSARDALRAASVTSDDAGREQAIAAALAAFDAPASAGGASPLIAATPLRPASVQRHPRRALRLVTIAAAAALLALSVPLLGRLDSGSNDQQVAAPTVGGRAELAPEGAEPGATGGGSLESPAMLRADGAANGDDLGSFDDLPGLTDAVRTRISTTASADSEGYDTSATTGKQAATAADSCPGEPDDDGTVIYRASATLEGRPVIVLVREDPEGGRTLVALDRSDCTKVAGGKLSG